MQKQTAGEPWVQSLLTRDYGELGVAERLQILVALTHLTLDGPTLRNTLEARQEEAGRVRKQMWEEARARSPPSKPRSSKQNKPNPHTRAAPSPSFALGRCTKSPVWSHDQVFHWISGVSSILCHPYWRTLGASAHTAHIARPASGAIDIKSAPNITWPQVSSIHSTG